MQVLFVHGGVSGRVKESLPPMDSAFDATRDAGTALDMVELAICSLEDDPALNAGFGSVLCRDGRLELDAGIAATDGEVIGVGGVANVTVRHPISLARRVLERTPHVLVTGDGAQELGGDMEQLADTTPERRAQWEEAVNEGLLGHDVFGSPEFVDTVGAVALDDHGNLAAGSSTGGVFGKLPGRVGDAPIFGAGFYVSKKVAVVGTGVGEAFLETLACLRFALLIDEGATPDEACAHVVETVALAGATAGLLAVTVDGAMGAAYHGGTWPVAGPDGPIEAIRVGSTPSA